MPVLEDFDCGMLDATSCQDFARRGGESYGNV